MTNEELRELKVLYEVFDSWQAQMGIKTFKGSKAQRKNALKRYNLLKKQRKEELAAAKAAKKAKLEEQLRAAEYSLENDFTKFWWEVLPANALDQCIQRIADLKKELASLQ